MKHPAVLVPLVLGSLALAVSVLLHGRLPESMAIHWNLSGEPDGFASRQIGAFALPVLTLLLSLGRTVIHRLEPRAPNLERSSKALSALVVAMALVLTLVHLTILAAAIGMTINPAAVAIGATGLLLTLSGNYMGKTRSNFAIGIRNRWTLSDEQVWDKTHRVGGRLFVAEGVVALLISLTGLSGTETAIALFAAVAATLGGLHLYSLSLWRNRAPGGGRTR
ncbi:SdpI family protein [Noviherbaspirillum sp.]|uniref:SdpI family protein n=1 Tax=Noviherbaspirillum sp. TaxID=1926288 RepID=UPI002D6F3505|nr:SdpI family protein [Noviherbaspirillum sp.]HZW20827.1 SdpI family protein [Noviherbaspirillum sp.]